MPQSNGIVIELRDGDQLYYAAASGTSSELIGLRLPLHASLSGTSILTGEALYCADSHDDPRVNRAACDRVGLRSMIVVPIPHQGQTVGVLKYHASCPDAFDEEDMVVAHLLVGPLAVGFSSVAEADAIRAKLDLQTVVRLKEQLVSTVSHELRTPLTSVAGALSILSSIGASELSERSVSLIGVAARNTDRLKRLVNDLLDMDRIDAGRLSLDWAEMDVRDILQSVLDENAPFASEAGVSMSLDVPAVPVIATTDSDRLFQVITNLVSNAAKFSPAGSDIRVSLDQAEGMARVRISDEGPGVPTEFRSRLFDRFSQSEHTRALTTLPGTGLGLAIARGIVEQLGGTIRLDEQVARGATFEVALPLDGRRGAVGP